MRILPIILTSSVKNPGTQKKNNVGMQNVILSSNTGDTVSFSSNIIVMRTRLDCLKGQQYPDDLYLDMDEIYETFEKQKSYHVWEMFRRKLADLLAKRTNYLGITNRAERSGMGASSEPSDGYPRTHYIELTDRLTKGKKYNQIIEFDWTKEYHELEDFFKQAECSPDEIKAELPQILRRQGWIKD